MSDISKCEGKTCCLASKCWRALAPLSNNQSWINPNFQGFDCGYFWPVAESAFENIPEKIEVKIK